MLKLFNFAGRSRTKKDRMNESKFQIESVQENNSQSHKIESEPLSEKDMAATRIQTLARRFVALHRVKKRSERIWERVFDPRAKRYFWFNKMNGTSQWKVPRLLRLYTETDHAAARLIQKVVRGFIGRMRTRKLVCLFECLIPLYYTFYRLNCPGIFGIYKVF